MKASHSICVSGWHYNFPNVYTEVLPRFDSFVVAHRDNDLLKSVKHAIIPNEGLEWGCYDWYIKNVWKKQDVLFMHDDLQLDETILLEVMKEAKGFDFGYVYGRRVIKKNKQHGRCLFISGKMIAWFLKNDNGFWHD